MSVEFQATVGGQVVEGSVIPRRPIVLQPPRGGSRFVVEPEGPGAPPADSPGQDQTNPPEVPPVDQEVTRGYHPGRFVIYVDFELEGETPVFDREAFVAQAVRMIEDRPTPDLTTEVRLTHRQAAAEWGYLGSTGSDETSTGEATS